MALRDESLRSSSDVVFASTLLQARDMRLMECIILLTIVLLQGSRTKALREEDGIWQEIVSICVPHAKLKCDDLQLSFLRRDYFQFPYIESVRQL